jgi:outer membrane protein TolC
VTPILKIAAPILLASVALFPASADDGLRIEDAIRSAWRENPGLAAGAYQVAAARADAQAAGNGHWPTLAVTAKGIGTSEPAGVFAIKLDQQRITAADFDPARLNYPDPVGGIGLGAGIVVPIWMGGRILAGQHAAEAQADAEASAQARRREEMALAVVQAYFGVQVASQGVRYADDVLEHARETERFVGERNQKGLALDADVARAVAFRAQAEAERAWVLQQLSSARSALAMLTGIDPARSSLVTPVEMEPAAASLFLLAGTPGSGGDASRSDRPDVVAARLRAQAAEAGIGVSRASLLPAIFAQAGVDTLRSSIQQGATWWSAALVVRWEIGVSSFGGVQAAEARSAAAASAVRWQEVQATREVEEARQAVATADARVRSAREAVTASESARRLREARYRQGLLPLTDVLDAQAALAGARALLLRSQLETRIARAQLELALGVPVEGVQS